MDAVEDLRLLFASGTPLLAVDTQEETRLLALVRRASGATPVWTWSTASGLARVGAAPIYGTADPDQLTDNLASFSGPWTVALCDPAPLLEDPTAARRLKEIAQRTLPGQTILLVGAGLTVPVELEGLTRTFRLPPPDPEELRILVERVEVSLGQRGIALGLADADRVRLAKALGGLTLADAERVLTQRGLADGKLDAEDIVEALRLKAEMLNQDGILEIITTGSLRLEDLGGLTELKEWLARRLSAGLDRTIDPPRGVLLAGVPGCGKSAVAQALATHWEVPLVLLDPGRVYRKYIGESEQRFDAAITTVGAMAPAVLWIDEIEKGFARSGEDGGVSERVLATFLRWLQDRPAGVFVVATANDVTRLPPELTRKGRFDELFFVDLPDRVARVEILRAQCRARNVVLADTDLASLADRADGFSGAEITAAIAAASYDGAITATTIGAELARTVPLARSRAGEIDALRAWATEHARAA
jgi:SpoVK/Ycf46/Vps4 family AAA+-type ATPase